jgi:hypothetical protein
MRNKIREKSINVAPLLLNRRHRKLQVLIPKIRTQDRIKKVTESGTDRIQTGHWIRHQVPVLRVSFSNMKIISKVSALTHISQQIDS